MTPLRTITLSVTLSLFISTAVTLLVIGPLNPTPSLVQMDMNATLTAFEKDIQQRDLNPAQQKGHIARFTAALDTVLRTYSHDNNAVIVVSPAIIGGAPDITRTISQETVNMLTNKENKQ